MYFIPKTTQLIYGGLNINNKQCSTFTIMYLGYRFPTHCVIKTIESYAPLGHKITFFDQYLSELLNTYEKTTN
jgi:hypothetical protein